MTHQELKQEAQSGDHQTARRWLRPLIVIAVAAVVLLTASFFVARHLWGWDIGHYCIQKALNSPEPATLVVLLVGWLALGQDVERAH